MLTVALVSVVIVATSAILLGVVTLITNTNRLSNQIFALLTGLVSAFVVVNYLVDHGPSHALLWSRGTFFLGCFMAWSMFAFMSNFPRRYWSLRSQWLMLALASVVALLSLTPEFIPAVTIAAGKTTVEEGPLYGIFVAFMTAIFIATGFAIATAIKRSQTLDRQRIRLVATSMVLSAAVLTATNVIIPLIVGNDGSAAWGPLSLMILIAGTTYAVIRHKLFDVRLVIARSLTYLMVLLTLGVAYIGVAFALSQFIFHDTLKSFNQNLFYAGLSLVLAFTFQPLRRIFERTTDRLFFRDQYDARLILDNISRILVSELDLTRLLSRSLDTVCREMRLEFGQFAIFNNGRVYRIEHFGPLPKRLMVGPDMMSLGSGMAVADDLRTGRRKELLDSHGIRVALALKTGEQFVGYLLLGNKLSGDSYTKADLELLALLGKELAVGISNAKAYAEISAFNLTLQDRVNHATSRLRVANRHLKELDKTKDEFLSMASHQLRTPLTTIKGYLSMMTEGDAGKLSATQQEFVDYAFDASERMVNLISDLLNVSRLEAGKFLIQTKPTDIAAMVADEVRQLQQHAVNKNLSLTFVPPAETLPLVAVDEGKTRQVVMNFIDNAIYYTKTGGVTVRLSRTPTAVRLEVIDTGIGVPEDAKKKLFSKFYRAENAQGVRPDGTGLGLYLARRVVTDQGGTIIFKSNEGQGSTFGFDLPLQAVTGKAPSKHG